MKTNSGKKLNEKHKLGAKHALYREDGIFYEHLKEFPGVLCDKDGFVKFYTKDEYINNPSLQRGQKLNVPNGISSMPNYQRFEDLNKGDSENIKDIVAQKSVIADSNITPIEKILASDIEPPDRIQTLTYRILRDTALAVEVKNDIGYVCQICNSDGIDIGDSKKYAEAHHIRPLGKPHLGPDVKGNLICVCPNCHVKLDYGAIKISSKIQEELELSEEYVRYHNENIYKR